MSSKKWLPICRRRAIRQSIILELRMRVCGVDIKSYEAIFVVCEPSIGAAIPINIKTNRLKLKDADDGSHLKSFLRAVEGFLHENNVDAVVIKERLGKGPRAASGVTFKIEAMFQIAHGKVSLVHGKTLDKFSKSNVAGIPAGLPVFQRDAFLASAWRLNEEKLL
ncbi:DUF3010 family protein [Rhizobium leguminosarum]|nr:DUF3010 family protein [Rhizobium leguminosarum]